jgi:hypothetical protein
MDRITEVKRQTRVTMPLDAAQLLVDCAERWEDLSDAEWETVRDARRRVCDAEANVRKKLGLTS